jgi:hypothetical protein
MIKLFEIIDLQSVDKKNTNLKRGYKPKLFFWLCRLIVKIFSNFVTNPFL